MIDPAAIRRWRFKAEELRTLSDACVDDSARAMYAQMADRWDSLANNSEPRPTRTKPREQ